jgi:hypothetical protein
VLVYTIVKGQLGKKGSMDPVAICIGDSFISIIILNKRSFFFVLLIVIASVGKMEMGFSMQSI